MNAYYPKLKTVFIHIPKTGGGSIRDRILKAHEMQRGHGIFHDHWKYSFSFAFVRNPFERLISGWKYSNRLFYKDVEDVTISECLDYIENNKIRIGPGHKNLISLTKLHCVPMTHPFNCIHMAQHIYRFESYKEDVIEVMNKLGISINKIPHTHKSTYEYSSYRDYYTPELKERTAKIFEKDLDTFRYIF